MEEQTSRDCDVVQDGIDHVHASELDHQGRSDHSSDESDPDNDDEE
jgi:hypothetical protein